MFRALRRANDRRRHAGGEYGWLFRPYTGDELVAIDCETTGIDTRTAEPVSIGAVKVRGDRVLTSESLDLRLRRPATLTGDSIRVHGLRGVDLDDGVGLDDALATLLDFIGNRPLLGWRLDFDMTILNRQIRPRFGFDLPNSGIDVAQLYHRQQRRSVMEPESPAQRFEAVAEALGVPIMGRHTALGDAVTTALMYLRLERAGMQDRREA
ncbi:MAG: 3'-5' exonuclease [Halomonas sp.]|uniref:3'-5' exonuclease n=2 Tax=Halomonadaceae TaxID=28256 RepID=A0ABS6ZN63_9GAMM|nr:MULTISPECIES: 3'-5' exonuclease [Halomonas]MBW6390872.1 3'-5' exonuclease [Halomonas antri]MDX5378893.1 3'-5' exonuclease [Halomonas sp.]MDX5503955.1 3'-5' exonuclease [Halomonas sp.]QTP58030.1 3'-5' exonuclease [Halomonas sulfidivorans]